MKFAVLICIVFASFQSGYSYPNLLQTDFGKIFGPCPNLKGSANPVLEKSDGEWYAHKVQGNSPWKYLRCPSTKFDFQFANKTVKTEFSTPMLPLSFEIEGEIQKIYNGHYEVTYQSGVFGDLPQKLVVLRSFAQGALVWSCLDFKFFHLESIQLMITSNEADIETFSNILISQAHGTLEKYGISPKSFVQVDQSCNYDSA